MIFQRKIRNWEPGESQKVEQLEMHGPAQDEIGAALLDELQKLRPDAVVIGLELNIQATVTSPMSHPAKPS